MDGTVEQDETAKKVYNTDKCNEETKHASKKAMTQEERLQLAAKLDKELDEFIEKLPRKKYQDGWPEDRWEEV